jgi:hypothetical protein
MDCVSRGLEENHVEASYGNLHRLSLTNEYLHTVKRMNPHKRRSA